MVGSPPGHSLHSASAHAIGGFPYGLHARCPHEYCLQLQIVAGEEIEHVFGARFGFSTLAAAGLGNLISDVVGIGTAEPVQVRAQGHSSCCAACRV